MTEGAEVTRHPALRDIDDDGAGGSLRLGPGKWQIHIARLDVGGRVAALIFIDNEGAHHGPRLLDTEWANGEILIIEGPTGAAQDSFAQLEVFWDVFVTEGDTTTSHPLLKISCRNSGTNVSLLGSDDSAPIKVHLEEEREGAAPVFTTNGREEFLVGATHGPFAASPGITVQFLSPPLGSAVPFLPPNAPTTPPPIGIDLL